MPQVTLELPFEKIVETVKRLKEEEQEQLLFAINEDYAKALGKNERRSLAGAPGRPKHPS